MFSTLEVSLLSVNSSFLPSMDFLIITGAGEEKMMTFLTGNAHSSYLSGLSGFTSSFESVLSYSGRIGTREGAAPTPPLRLGPCSYRSNKCIAEPLENSFGKWKLAVGRGASLLWLPTWALLSLPKKQTCVLCKGPGRWLSGETTSLCKHESCSLSSRVKPDVHQCDWDMGTGGPWSEALLLKTLHLTLVPFR